MIATDRYGESDILEILDFQNKRQFYYLQNPTKSLNRNLAIVLIIAAFVAGTFLSASTVTAEKGGPWAEIWAAIFGLQTQVEDKYLTL